MTNSVTSNQNTAPTGRSPNAAQIYQQYLSYYNDINTKITAINQQPSSVSSHTSNASGQTTCGVDRLYIMAYFNSMTDEEGWVNGWANWMENTYKFSPAQISVGLDSQSGAYDVNAFAAWAASKGYSTSYWDYDPANPTQSNQATTGIQQAYKAAA